MGGTTPNHFSMLLYGLYSWYYYRLDIDCNKERGKMFPELTHFHIRSWDAIIEMVYVHTICIVMYFVGKLLSKKNDYASYIKTTLKVIRITVYF